jgi:membrane protein DedA with SNARE-associated domain
MGQAVGDRWDEWQKNLHYADYVILAAIAGTIVYLLIRRRRGRQNRTAPLPDSPQ